MMNPATLRTVIIAALLLFAGWTVGRAQTSSPDFELVVTTTATDTSIETSVDCVRGCKLSWVERGLNPRAVESGKFSFSCKGENPVSQCPSGVIGGWLPK